jgi:hypothetical protein
MQSSIKPTLLSLSATQIEDLKLGHFGSALEWRQAGDRRNHAGMGKEYDLERNKTGGQHCQTVYQKGISLSKKAMLAIEARLERNPILPKWDILIRHV